MSTLTEQIEAAVKLHGSQAKLAAAMGCTQQQISYLLKAKTISAEMAIAIDRATDGTVSRFELRPDLAEAFAKEGEAA
jgi:DNA-binding transcriptional regulator YdaS (Cro superfamily)